MVPVSAQKPLAEQTSTTLRREYKVVRSSLTLKVFYNTEEQTVRLEPCAKPHEETSCAMSARSTSHKGDGIENANSMRSGMPLVQNETPSRYVLQELRE